MYDFKRRAQLSAVIPIIVTVLYIIRLIQIISVPHQQTNAQLAGQTIGFALEVIITYLLTLLFFSLETLVRAYITDPESQESAAFKNEFENATLSQKISVLFKWDNAPIGNRITRSVILQVALIIFTVYALTSSGTVIGVGVGLGILLQMVSDQIRLLRTNRDASLWFWQIKTNIPRDIQNIYVGAITVLVAVFLLFLIR